jgi:hypothetical protein
MFGMRTLRLLTLACLLLTGIAYVALPARTHAKTAVPAPAAITGTSNMLPPPVCPPWCPGS